MAAAREERAKIKRLAKGKRYPKLVLRKLSPYEISKWVRGRGRGFSNTETSIAVPNSDFDSNFKHLANERVMKEAKISLPRLSPSKLLQIDATSDDNEVIVNELTSIEKDSDSVVQIPILKSPDKNNPSRSPSPSPSSNSSKEETSANLSSRESSVINSDTGNNKRSRSASPSSSSSSKEENPRKRGRPSLTRSREASVDPESRKILGTSIFNQIFSDESTNGTRKSTRTSSSSLRQNNAKV